MPNLSFEEIIEQFDNAAEMNNAMRTQLVQKPFGLDMDELAETVDRVMPVGHPPFEENKARTAVSEQLTYTMRDIINDFHQTKELEQKIGTESYFNQPRHLREFVERQYLFADHEFPQQYEDEWKACRETIENGSPEAKAELFMERLNDFAPTFQELQGIRLNGMTDEQIAVNFQNIFTAKLVLNYMHEALEDPGLAFSPEQTEQLRKLEGIFKEPVNKACQRADYIANGFYSMFPPEQLLELDQQKLLNADPDFFKKNPKFKNYLDNIASPMMDQMANQAANAAVRDVMKRHGNEKVTWKDLSGKEIHVEPKENGEYSMDRNPFREGKPLVAQYADGTQRVFLGRLSPVGSTAYKMDNSRKLALQGDAKKTSKDLMQEATKADPWYLLSGSTQYKNMRNAMEAVGKAYKEMGNPPTALQVKEMRELSRQLEQTSTAYLGHKLDGKDPGFMGKNETERNRIEIARKIQRFAKQQSELLEGCFRVEPTLEAEAKVQEQDRLKRKMDMLDQFAIKKPGAAVKDNVTIPQETVDKWMETANRRCPKQPDEPENSALNKLNGVIQEKIHSMATEQGGGFQRAAKQTMALMTGYDLIAQMRKATGSKEPGDLEKMCNNDMNEFVKSVASVDGLRNKMKETVLPTQFQSFVKNKENRQIAKQVINQAKAPAQKSAPSQQRQMSQQRQIQPKPLAPKK